MQNIGVLAASSRKEDFVELRASLDGTAWIVSEARDIETALKTVKTMPVPIVLCDRDLSQISWQHAIERLIAARPRACVILLSNVADQYLWEEVVQHGGFDLLTRPFRKDQVLSVLLFAYTQYRDRLPGARAAK